VDNPFERYGLDPRDGIAEITRRLKELAEDARSDAEREAIRAAWEELTLHPARRLRAALFAHPESRKALGAPPALPRLRGAAGGGFELRDLVARPSVIAALPAEVKGAAAPDVAPSLDDDPILG
jgi:hypothetical protein